MNERPTRQDCRILQDHALASVLLALLRICAQVRGVVKDHNDISVGRHYYPLAMWMCSQHDPYVAHDVPPWMDKLADIARSDVYDAEGWIGRRLSRPTAESASMMAHMKTHLLETVRETPFEFAVNVDCLARIFGLNDVERRLLSLAACATLSQVDLEDLDLARPASLVYRALALAIDAKASEVEEVLHWNGRLAQSRLMEASFDGTDGLADCFALSRFGKLLFRRRFRNAGEMFDAILQRIDIPADPAALVWPALETGAAIARRLIASTLCAQEKGVNILLHGAPGTGKTAFARQLLADCAVDGYEVPYADDCGAEASRTERLAALHAAKCMLGRTEQAVLLLDEAEDVFQHHQPWTHLFAADRTASKAWMNRLLENNTHPVVWVTNSVEAVDPAFLRRFTLCLHFATPGLDARRAIVRQHLAPVGVSAKMVEAIARRSTCSPAQVASAAKLVRLATNQDAAGPASTVPADTVALLGVQEQARVMGQQILCRRIGPMSFDPAYVNVGGRIPCAEIIDAIVRNAGATVLMSGPPGTGKTQMAGYLAEKMGRELVTHSASTILAPYLGESERNVASMFDDCDPGRQILFLDEAEALLGAREDPRHPAHGSVTSEFLRRIETFPGVFLCATNHAAWLDAALMRRFSFRLQFRPLNAAQRMAMLASCAGQARPSADAAASRRLNRLEGLTPGDFANVARRFALLGVDAGVDDWLDELEQEWQAQSGATGRIGF